MTEDWLVRALRSQEPHIDDAGFSDRVLSRLPRAPEPSSWRADWIVIAGAATGSAVVAAQFPFQPFLNLLVESAQITWIGGAAMLVRMTGALFWDSLQRD